MLLKLLRFSIDSINVVVQKKRFSLLFYASAFVIRMLIVVLLILGFPVLESHDFWYFHHGGDQNYYFDFANVLVEGGSNQYFSVNLGWPAIMAIMMHIFDVTLFSELLPYVVIFNGIMLGGLSVVLVGKLTARLLNSVIAGYFAGLLWAVMPWLIYLLLWPHPYADLVRMPYVPGVAWLQGLPDGPGMFFILVSVYCFVRYLDSYQISWIIFSGVSCGLMLLFRVHFVTMLLLLVCVIAMRGYWWDLLLFLSVTGIMYVPQIIYNRFSSLAIGAPGYNPWLPGYLYFGFIDVMADTVFYYDNSSFNVISVDHWIDYIVALVQGNFIVFCLLCVVFCLYIFCWIMTRRVLDLSRSLIIFVAPLASIGILSVSSVFADNAYRFALPAIPFVLILGIWFCVFVIRNKVLQNH